MTVGIVVPSLNQGRFLGQTLESLLAQDIDVRAAVLDAGSQDDSREVIQRYEHRLTYWRSAPDRGQAAAVNEGVTRLGGARYVGWLNSDDILLPGALSMMAGYLDRHPECVAVFGRAHIIDEPGRVVGEFPTRAFTRHRLARGSIVCQPASLFRRNVWDALGGLDESLQMCLDYDLWWRLTNIGPIGFLDEIVACSRDHPATKTRTRKDLLYTEAFKVVRRHLGYVPWRWCVSEAAYRWRTRHDGQRAIRPVEQLACGLRALVRYLDVNALGRIAVAMPPATSSETGSRRPG
jgi:GT2 family glycosyltransferase